MAEGKEKTMRTHKKMSLLLLGLIMTAVMTIGIYAEQTADKSDITIRKMESQTVLYTIYRGEYQNIGKAIGSLYALAMKNKILPHGSLYCVYLNNPQYVSGEHYLVEIRIPVDQDALKLAGTLGEMTDVKTIQPMEVAVTRKSPGQTDHSLIYNGLYLWIAKNGYIVAENACEIFTSNAWAMDYAQMKSEIMIPVKKIPKD
jgi:effector-binding domain-containing protein